MHAEQTIAAVATPLGSGGIAIIRISGKRALEVADRAFSGNVREYQTHVLHYGQIVDAKGRPVDSGLIAVMLGKRSYTGEDTVEIHCHGGVVASRRVLEVVLAAGASPASPGEFTFRAFMNGKLDLAQAESVQQLIGAKSDRAFDLAQSHLEGGLSRKIQAFQTQQLSCLAHLEAWIDFPEDEIDSGPQEKKISALIEEMSHLLGSYHDGRRIEKGVGLCIVGTPNVGKSSLMNALLEHERAIVSTIPGTTRDLIEADLLLNGLHFSLVDTAGIRESTEEIEQEGISRSKKAMEKADLILLTLDSSRELGDEDYRLLESVSEDKTLVVWNKIDLECVHPPILNHPHIVEISAKTGQGLDLLKEKIDEILWNETPPETSEVLITSLRHKEALTESIEGCQRALAGMRENLSPELPAADLRHALERLSTIIGINVSEDILSTIFSQFCIGK